MNIIISALRDVVNNATTKRRYKSHDADYMVSVSNVCNVTNRHHAINTNTYIINVPKETFITIQGGSEQRKITPRNYGKLKLFIARFRSHN